MYDIHIHSNISFDSDELPENYIAEALKKDIKVIGFSEHYDYDAYLDGAFDVSLADLDTYSDNITRVRKCFPDIDILFGLEVGYRAEALRKYRELISRYDFDYIINSLHTLNGCGDYYHDEFFAGKSLHSAYSDYFDGVLESVNADFDYQIVGHLGYVSRYRTGAASIIYSEFKTVLDEILTSIIKRDKCLEINTSSGTSGDETLPNSSIIERYLSLGGRNLSFGSDAHAAKDYLRKHDILLNYLKSIGVTELCYYKKRKKITYKI